MLSRENYQLHVRDDYNSAQEMALLVRASCTMPLLAGGPAPYKEGLFFDGGLIESIPAFSAIRDGATHVLVFRSQSANYRKENYPAMLQKIIQLYDKDIARLLQTRPAIYNVEADTLAKQKTTIEKRCQQITIKKDISRGSLELNPSRPEVEQWISEGYEACLSFFKQIIK